MRDPRQRTKQPRRPHFIPEWALAHGIKNQTELAKQLDADKSVVSRWYSGATPSEDYQKKLADLFKCTPTSLFRHPDDVWVSDFLGRLDADEITRAKGMLSAAFPHASDPDE